ncbi:phosphonoacetaldehyde hydrolase [Peribacillus simplex]|uniref:Phosphonoacetaldehyde hydrolase n=1 Tax=Peribacillus simplex TaxID=1478 RepID=A0A8B5XU97_9BACI|nr:phosphonoacetaldehyde hydrolase [Peribacillus simplex]MED3911787.1 phosphonoacetaldehyde hydrolase [Peribacillus simplex]TVX78020.1 phosphonoacetaldehyde hydrolase [Peribacillus simplex]
MESAKECKEVQAVIFDWAGTTVDYGCFAPVQAFVEIFRIRGIDITIKEAREPMGLLKMDHIKELLKMKRISNLWIAKFEKEADERDLKSLYMDFEALLFKVLKENAKPIPGVIELVGRLRQQGIKIGSTTGYTREMIDVVKEEAKKWGYHPDSIVASTDVPTGRPAPWMCFKTAMNLQVYPLSKIVKVGDTISDIKEGISAGMWTVAVLKGGSEIGLSEAEINEMDPYDLQKRMKHAENRFLNAGADFVIDEIGDLLEIIDRINYRLTEKKDIFIG